MQALLSVNKGESIYKIMRSQWLRDSEGPILWKMISKKCRDGNIEVIFYSQRADGAKYVYQQAVLPEKEFPKFLGAIRRVVYRFFPDADLKIEDAPTPQITDSGLTNVDPSRMTVYPAGKFGFFLAKLNALKIGLFARFWTRVKMIWRKNNEEK